MRILGFINAFDELAGPERRLGRKVANFGQAAALMSHGGFDELHFFLPFAGAVKPFRKVYGPFMGPGVKLLAVQALPQMLATTRYTALHAAELDRYFPELCHLRNRFAAHPCPVTCTPHSLSYWGTQVRNLYKVLPGPRAYDSVLCTSRAARGYLEACLGAAAEELKALGLAQAGYAGRLDVCPLGVEAAEFRGLPKAEALKRLKLKPGPLTLLCLGRLNPTDKFDLMPLVGALSLLAKGRDLRLILAGAKSGGYADQLVDEALRLGLGGRVHVFADFPGELKPALFAASDIFVSPADNLQETFGLSILEAMAAGLPVVAADFSGYRDLVGHEATGLLVPTTGPADYGPLDAARPIMADHIAALQAAQRTALDFDALLAALARLADDPELRLTMGRAGRERVARRFDWRVVVGRMNALWDRMAAQAAAAPPAQPEPDVCGAGLARLFGHFVSGALPPDAVLVPGPLAQAFAQGAWAQSPHPDAAPGLPTQGLAALLEALNAAGGRADLPSLARALAGRLAPVQVEHLALHGLKYGVFSRGAG